MQKKILLLIFFVFFVNLFHNIPLSEAKFEYGNLVLGLKNEKLKQEKINPVIYPHWVHRMFFRCKVCHEGIMKMENGSNEITMEKIQKGEFCGKCHNDKISFGIGKENCNRCHSLSGAEAELTLTTDKMTQKLYPTLFTNEVSEDKTKREVKFLDPFTVSMEEYSTLANKLGVKWNITSLNGKGFPKDKFGLIDFEKLVGNGVVSPLATLDPSEIEEPIKDNIIYFDVLSDFVDGVPFNHKTHSQWLKCDEPCHNRLFVAEAGGNLIHMRENSEGKFCGYCHGRVAFHLGDCNRCHSSNKDKIDSLKGEVIKRKNPLIDKGMTVAKGGLMVGEKGKVGPKYEKTERTDPIMVPKPEDANFKSKREVTLSLPKTSEESLKPAGGTKLAESRTNSEKPEVEKIESNKPEEEKGEEDLDLIKPDTKGKTCLFFF